MEIKQQIDNFTTDFILTPNKSRKISVKDDSRKITITYNFDDKIGNLVIHQGETFCYSFGEASLDNLIKMLERVKDSKHLLSTVKFIQDDWNVPYGEDQND